MARSEGVDETFVTGLRLNEFIGFTTEYVNWRIPDDFEDPVVHRIEWILHVYN